MVSRMRVRAVWCRIPAPRSNAIGRTSKVARLVIAAAVLGYGPAAALAQVSSPTTPQVGSPTIGPPAPIDRTGNDALLLVPSDEPLPDNLTLEGALGAA